MRHKPQNGQGDLFGIRCVVCQAFLVRTPSGYLACPLGHGKLMTEETALPDVEPCGSLFEPDLPE